VTDKTDWFLQNVLVHEPALRAYLRRLTRGEADVSDLLQDVYSHILALSDEARGRIGTVRGFLFRAARNAAFDEARHRRIVPLRTLTEIEVSNVVDDGPPPEQVLEAHQELERLADVMRSLPERCRQVLTLRKIYGLSVRQISEQLGIAEHTVEKHISVGLRLCAQRLYEGEEGQANNKAVVKPRHRTEQGT